MSQVDSPSPKSVSASCQQFRDGSRRFKVDRLGVQTGHRELPHHLERGCEHRVDPVGIQQISNAAVCAVEHPERVVERLLLQAPGFERVSHREERVDPGLERIATQNPAAESVNRRYPQIVAARRSSSPGSCDLRPHPLGDLSRGLLGVGDRHHASRVDGDPPLQPTRDHGVGEPLREHPRLPRTRPRCHQHAAVQMLRCSFLLLVESHLHSAPSQVILSAQYRHASALFGARGMRPAAIPLMASSTRTKSESTSAENPSASTTSLSHAAVGRLASRSLRQTPRSLLVRSER